MADIKKLCESLEKHGFHAVYFDTAQEAADYLDSRINGKTVAFGGSMTLKSMELYPKLSSHNQVVWHWEGGDLTDAMSTQVYLTSVNAVAETGELINIDGNGKPLPPLDTRRSTLWQGPIRSPLIWTPPCGGLGM